MSEFFRNGTFVSVHGGPTENGKVFAVRAVDEEFRVLEYKVEYGANITATTGWLDPTMVSRALPHGSHPKRLMFQLRARAYVDMGDFSVSTHLQDHHLLYDTDVHEKACNLWTARAIAHNARWAKDWPHRCPNCQGRGQFYSPGSRYEPPDIEPCHLCSEAGLCPRCGKSLYGEFTLYPTNEQTFAVNTWFEKELPCPHCSFKLSDYDGFIDVGDCGCYDRNVSTDYTRQEPETEISHTELLEWIKDNLDTSGLTKGDK